VTDTHKILAWAVCIILLGNPLTAITVHQENGKAVLSMTAEECLNLNITATPQEGVDYVGGVDVNGDPVAPANLPSSPQIKPPSIIAVPIWPRLDTYLTAQNPIVRDFARKAYAGNVVVNLKNNKAYYNGQPLFDVPSALLEKACKDHMQPSVSTDDSDSVGEVVGL
jgi:hypothetical protein